MVTNTVFKQHEIVVYLENLGFETKFYDSFIHSSKRFFSLNVAFNISVEFIVSVKHINMTIVEQKADFTNNSITQKHIIDINGKSLDFFLKYLKNENDYLNDLKLEDNGKIHS